MLGLVLAALISLAIWLYTWGLKRKNYWKDHKIPHVESPIFLGNMYKPMFMQETVTKTLTHIYYHPNASGQPFVGFNIFHRPAIFLRDPELIKRITVKDFNDFSSRYSKSDPTKDPIGANNLFQVENPIWRAMRQKLTPVFTSGKMKQWFKFVDLVGNNLNRRLHKNSGTDQVLEVRELAGYYTLDGISLVALATETNSLFSDVPTDVFVAISKAWNLNLWRKLQINVIFFLSDLTKWITIKTFSEAFDNFVREIFNAAFKQRLEEGTTRGDLIDALIAVKKAEENEQDSIFKDDVLVAQASVFLFAGFETSSHIISVTMYALAMNMDVQTKLRAELKEVLEKQNGALDYDTVINLPYMNMVIKESLRKYLSISYVDRCCTTDNYSLEPYSSFKVPKGMPVYVPTYCLQNDPDYFPDPEKFDPSRFEPNSSSFKEYTYMPFGVGPRACIGERFGKMQVQLGLAHVLRSFRVERCPLTQEKLVFSPESVFTRAEGGIFLNFVKDELVK